MAVSNSCVNPIVYGSYTINLRKELNRCFGRKTQPPVLARKSTGSTALRTTVTAHLNASSTLKMSTHTQILPPRGKLRGSNSIRGNSPSGSISRESPLSHSRRTLYPPSPHTFSSTPSSLQVSCVSSSPKYPSPSHSHPAGSTATGCLMLEIDVEGNRSERDKPSQDDEEGVSAIRETERISVSLEAVSDDLSSTHHTVDNDSHRFPYFPAGTKIQKHGKLPENAMHVAPVPMTSNAKAEAIFAENPKRENGDHEDSVVIIPRKLSTDSGIFFESRQRKKYPNPPALTNPPTSARSRASYDEARETTSTSSTIELKGSNSFSEIV
ncbi:hypothetical protein SK128_021796 [Halocaridina rubra]|uniref:Uncharacterized protein n=1 Tax=Halocaridina rubra TaxID=373956 RepID=A0AAN8XFF6_HALRR